MRNITTTLALFLTSMGTFVQVTTPTSKLSVSDLTGAKTEQRIFLKAISETNEKWFTGELASADIVENTLFVLKKKEDGYVLKRLSTNNYTQPNEANISFGAEASAQLFELDITDQDLTGGEPYVRLKIGQGNVLNVQRQDRQPKFASGTGAWSVVNVYDATDYLFPYNAQHPQRRQHGVCQASL